jgi:hypothetical protein
MDNHNRIMSKSHKSGKKGKGENIQQDETVKLHVSSLVNEM